MYKWDKDRTQEETLKCAGFTSQMGQEEEWSILDLNIILYQADGGGMRVGIIGIGGLGQMGVRLAKAMGNTVTAISTSPNKEAAAR